MTRFDFNLMLGTRRQRVRRKQYVYFNKLSNEISNLYKFIFNITGLEISLPFKIQSTSAEVTVHIHSGCRVPFSSTVPIKFYNLISAFENIA